MNKAARMLVTGVVLGSALLAGSTLYAQGQGGGGGGGASTNFFVILFFSGGDFLGVVTTVPIWLCSIWSTAMILQFAFTLNRDKIAPPEIIVQIDELIEQQQYEEALNICDATRNYMTAIVGAALAKMSDGYDAMAEAAANAQEEENTKLSQRIGWLNLLGTVAPMMGLFGTVVGMVVAFAAIANSPDQPSPKDLAGGIFTALITTVWGLIVAMPSLTALFIFKNRLQRLTLELGNMASEILDRLRAATQGK